MSTAGEVKEQARRRFREAYGRLPAAVAAAPGRMNVIGEHTDYNQGWVLPAAVDRFIAVAVHPRPEAQVLLCSDRDPAVVRLPGLPAAPRREWTDYVTGVARELGFAEGFDLAAAGDIPIGAGMSSSAALMVATAVALLAARGTSLAGVDLARVCQRAENGFVGARTGIMDPFTAICARAGHAIFLDCATLESEHVPLPGPELVWLLADTRVPHELSHSAYNQRRAECEAAAAALGLSSLRDAGDADLARLEDPVLHRRARHVISENARVHAAADALRRGDARALGRLMSASHESLRTDFEVSAAELDGLVALAAESSLGARMMGAGFGGCVLVLAQADGLHALKNRLREGYLKRFGRLPAFYRVQSVDGAVRSGW